VYQSTPDGWKFVFPEFAVEQFANPILSARQTQAPADKGG
jgi:hypothetical protein